jgi:putative endopeptidase
MLISATSLSTAPVRAGDIPSDVPPLGYSAQNMDQSVDPRQDFYRFAAGNWLRKTEIAPSEAAVGGFTLLARQMDVQLLALIQQAAKSSGAPKGSPQQQVGDFYRAAMDSARRDAQGLQPLADDLQRIAAAKGSPADYGALAGRLQGAVGGSPLINAVAMPDAKNSSTYVLALAPGAQLLEQDEYAKPENQRLREIYRTYIVAMLSAAGDTAEAARTHAARIMALESKMAAAMMSPLQMREPANNYNMMRAGAGTGSGTRTRPAHLPQHAGHLRTSPCAGD